MFRYFIINLFLLISHVLLGQNNDRILLKSLGVERANIIHSCKSTEKDTCAYIFKYYDKEGKHKGTRIYPPYGDTILVERIYQEDRLLRVIEKSTKYGLSECLIEYDKEGRITRLNNHFGFKKAKNTDIKYRRNGSLKKIVMTSGPHRMVVFYKYHNNGNLKSQRITLHKYRKTIDYDSQSGEVIEEKCNYNLAGFYEGWGGTVRSLESDLKMYMDELERSIGKLNYSSMNRGDTFVTYLENGLIDQVSYIYEEELIWRQNYSYKYW